MPGPADTYLMQHPELFRNNGAMTREQRYDNTAQKKYGSKSMSVLPPEFTQEQLEQMYVQSRKNGTPWNGPVPNITLARQLEQVYGQDPNLTNPLIQSTNANPISSNKQMQDARQPEPEKMGTVGPTTYNKAQAEIKEGQEKEGIYGGSDFYAAKRAHEEAYKKNVKEGQEAKMLEHVAKVQPQQDVTKIKETKNLVDEMKKATKSTSEPDGKTKETEQTEEKTDNKMEGAGRNVLNGMLNAIMQQQRGPNVLDASANANKALAQDYRNASANRQMEAQASQQIANQNPYTEAGKQASVQNDAQNRQNVQKAGVLGAGAALARTTTAPDVASEKAREDQQRGMAAMQREKADEMQGMGTGAEGDSRTLATASQDYNRQMFEAGSLANGGYGSDFNIFNREKEKSEGKEQQPKEQEQAQEQETQTPGTPAQQPTQQQQTGAKQVDNNNAAIAGASVGDWIIRNDGTKVTLTQEDIDWAKEHNVSSDERIKFIKDVASKGDDARMAWIKEDWEKNGMPDEGDFYWLLQKLGKFKCGEGECERERDIFNDDDWDDVDDSVLKGYAEHIKNYVYNYKPEAQNVDPTIDPNQEHIGPMAQDIEQVNPACVNETPEGVKTVDTARLAMMNAGAIADLAREVQEIKQMLGGMR